MSAMLTSFVENLQGGTDAQERVYPQVAPDGVLRPYIVYQRVSAINSNSSNLTNTQMQIDVYATTYVQARTIADQVAVLMLSWSYQNISGNSHDLFESDVKLHRISSDYSIWHYVE